MERLNFCNTYKQKNINSEDNLTRLFFVLMRFSSHTANLFYEYCYSEYINSIEHAYNSELPEFKNLFHNDVKIFCQKGNPVINSEFLLSVLITDEKLNYSPIASNREEGISAVYDGLIQCGNELTLIIENKPNSRDVRNEQLSPSRENLDPVTKIIENVVVLEWKEILKRLNRMAQNNSLPDFEIMMINDFIDFIDEHFGILNPYDKYDLCKNNEPLLRKRSQNILASLVKDDKKELVSEHKGWGASIDISCEFNEIREIGLIAHPNPTDKSWKLELAVLFGQTGGQAKNLYLNKINLNYFYNTKWLIEAGFFITSVNSIFKVFYKSANLDNYVNYWCKNPDKIKSVPRDSVKSMINELEQKGIIINGKDKQEAMENKFFAKDYKLAFISPGVNLKYVIPDKEAIKMDSENEIQGFLKEKIYEAFNLIGGQKEKLGRIFK